VRAVRHEGETPERPGSATRQPGALAYAIPSILMMTQLGDFLNAPSREVAGFLAVSHDVAETSGKSREFLRAPLSCPVGSLGRRSGPDSGEASHPAGVPESRVEPAPKRHTPSRSRVGIGNGAWGIPFRLRRSRG